MQFVIQWWRQPDRYQWLASYLDTHGVQSLARRLIVIALVIGGCAPVAIVASDAGPAEPSERVVTVVAGLLGMSTMLLWVRRDWPARRCSLVFAVVVTVCISAALLAGTDPEIALAGCALFVLIGGYIAIFHSAKLLVFSATVAVGTAAVLAVRVARQDPVLAATEFAVVVSVNLAVIAASHWMIHMLSVDMVNSDLDPLTGLLNRRACWHRTAELLALHSRSEDCHLLVVIIDLDRFKKLNDTRGHAVGDRALVAIGRALRGHSRQQAVVARVGGEEFFIADVITDTGTATVVAERLRAAILATPPHLSGSVGAVTIPLPTADDGAADVIDRLAVEADGAMYEAKRAGGNQFRIRQYQSLP